MHLESDLHKMRSLSGCDEFPLNVAHINTNILSV
jgi:hypothetical protein